jgi:hypothetical protein
VVEHVARLEDPRVARAQRQTVGAVITIALCGVIGGAESWVEIAEFGRTKVDWFTAFLDRPTGMPSHDTFGRVFAQLFAPLDAQQFAACFATGMQAVAAVLPTPVIALDGKTARGSHDRGAGKAPRHLVSAWATTNRLVVAQVAVADKSNEITACPQLLQQLALEDGGVTIAARGCQTAIAAQVLEQDAD